MNTHNNEYDWAICILEDYVGNTTGCFGVSTYSNNSLLNDLDVRLLGYPSDTNYGFQATGLYQYESGDKITNVGNNYFWYSTFSASGFSGGPIRRTSDDHIVGVHFGDKSGSKGLGVRITKEMFNIIASYR